MAVLDEAEVVYVARVGSRRILSANLGVGSRLPAHCTSMGKVLLAWLDEASLRRIAAGMTFTRFTPRTVASFARLRDALRTVRRKGYAIDDQELDLGLRSCAAPVLDRGGAAVAAVNVSVSSARATHRDVEARYLPHLLATAREISELARTGL
jgi:IclR family pca regulon transcriptional regulator